MSQSLNVLAHKLADIARQAGAPILDIYSRPFKAEDKADGSPVTEADLAADRVIRTALHHDFPDIPVISEETFAPAASLPSRFFLVDPLDGTKEFIKKTGEFTVNIALIEEGESKAGAIFVPAIGQMLIGGETAFRINANSTSSLPDLSHFEALKTRPCNAGHMTALASLSHRDAVTDEFLQAVKPQSVTSAGSSYKFCVVASGQADLYPRVGPTMGWDTAAGQAILQAAGGTVLDRDGNPMRYRDPALRNGPFLAIGDRNHAAKLAQIFTSILNDQSRAETGAAATASL